MNSSGSTGVNAGLGLVPGTSRVISVDRSGRRTADEAMRYAAVAASAQAVSYAVFAALVVTALDALPQLAVIAGAACGALVSYSGQALFAFRPRTPPSRQSNLA